MFGRQDNQQDNTQIPDQSINGALDADQPVPDAPSSMMTSPEASAVSSDWQHPGTPTDTPSAPTTAPDMPSAPAPMTTASVTPSAPTDDDDTAANDLIDIKQRALNQLSPLVGHLDQTPEEKFRTTMMMIQASDDQSLVRSAYDAAQQIEDEKARAQALLDIINEINYFTQHQEA